MTIQPLKQTARRIFGGLYSSYDWVLDYFTLFQDRYWKRWLVGEARISDKDVALDIGRGTGVLEEKVLSRGEAPPDNALAVQSGSGPSNTSSEARLVFSAENIQS